MLRRILAAGFICVCLAAWTGQPAFLFARASSAPLSLQVVTPQNAAGLETVKTISFTPWELVTALAWSPDQKILVAAVSDQLYGFDGQTWDNLWKISVGAYTHSLAFSPDGTFLAAGSRDGWVRIWKDLPKGSIGTVQGAYLEIDAHKKGVNCVAFDPANRYLASGGNDAVARFWHLETGEKMGEMIGGTFAVPAIAFSPDGKTLAVVNGDMVRLREVGSERITGTIQAAAPMFSIAFHPSGSMLVTGSTDNRLDAWDPSQAFRTGMEDFPAPLAFSGHEGKKETYQTLVWQVVFDPAGQLIASAGGDGTVRIWNLQNQAQITAIKMAKRAMTSIAFSPDGSLLAAGSLDGAIYLWQVKN